MSIGVLKNEPTSAPTQQIGGSHDISLKKEPIEAAFGNVPKSTFAATNEFSFSATGSFHWPVHPKVFDLFLPRPITG